MTLGEFRKLTANLPDNVEIYPRFPPGYEPDDSEPGVQIEGFEIWNDKEGPYVAIIVYLVYLEEEEGL